MARYVHRVSGARVEVRDDKVMDSSWEAESEKKPTAKKSTPAKSKS